MLKMDAEPDSQRASTRQFIVDIQRIQFVVLIREVQQSKRDLRATARESIAGISVELPKIITGRAQMTILGIPKRLPFRKDTTGTVVNGEKIQIVKNSFHSLLGLNRVRTGNGKNFVRHFREIIVQHSSAQAIHSTQG